MDAFIELDDELLVDRSRVTTPQMRLLLAAVGRPLVTGSPWVVVDKRIANVYPIGWSAPKAIQTRAFCAA
jgi:hypothetical protein